MHESNWGTMEEAARYLGVSAKTIRRMITRGEIRAKKFGPRTIRVDMDSLEQSGRSLAWNAA